MWLAAMAAARAVGMLRRMAQVHISPCSNPYCLPRRCQRHYKDPISEAVLVMPSRSSLQESSSGCAQVSTTSSLPVCLEASSPDKLTFPLYVAGAVVPKGKREGKREGSEEGCTSLEHPKPLSRAPEGHLGSRLGSSFGGKEYTSFTGPQGIIGAAQIAQAASALQQSVQQSGLGPYFMQQTYPPHLAQAQLQQVQQASQSIVSHSPFKVKWAATSCAIVHHTSSKLGVLQQRSLCCEHREDMEAMPGLASLCAGGVKQHLLRAGGHGELGQAVSL